METSKTEQGPIETKYDQSVYNPTDSWIEHREDALELIREERRRQFIKWGARTYDDGTWCKVLAEEFGEMAQEMLKIQFSTSKADKELALECLEKETIQLAAVAAAIVQQLRSGNA